MLPMPSAPGVGAAIGSAVAVEVPLHSFPATVQLTRPPPLAPCAGTCGDTSGEDTGVSTHANVGGSDGSGRVIDSGRALSMEPPHAGA